MMRHLYSHALYACAVLLLAACTPKYPKCDKDEHCREGEFCVNGMCQQCRDDKDCGQGKRCVGGRCEVAAASCKTDADCGPGGKCRDGRCLQPGQCITNEDCPENQECQGGICVAPPKDTAGKAPCTPLPIYFDFNESVLTTEATAKLQAAATCIKSVGARALRLEGHCDPRGTEEYNMALGDRRAQSVKKYLGRMGIAGNRMRPVSKGKLEARGTDEASWGMDRKVVFIWE